MTIPYRVYDSDIVNLILKHYLINNTNNKKFLIVNQDNEQRKQH
jgi:hypothetical protein